MFYKKDIMKIDFENSLGDLKIPMVALYNKNAISEKDAREIILEGSYSDDVVVITKEQYDRVFMNNKRNKTKEMVETNKPLHTSQKKREYLESIGFQIDYSGEPREQMGTILRMEMWKMIDDSNIHRLYIHFNSKDGNYCNLYCGEETNDVEVFSERNLISEMNKRFKQKVEGDDKNGENNTKIS